MTCSPDILRPSAEVLPESTHSQLLSNEEGLAIPPFLARVTGLSPCTVQTVGPAESFTVIFRTIVIAGFILASAGMALFTSPVVMGTAGLLAAMVLLYTGINVQRSPFQALVADLVPSRYWSFATGSVTFQMCVGAIVFLMLGQVLGMRPAFLIAAGTVVVIAIVFALSLREPAASKTHAVEATVRSLFAAGWSAIRGAHPGMRAILLATLLLQLTFQTFTTCTRCMSPNDICRAGSK